MYKLSLILWCRRETETQPSFCINANRKREFGNVYTVSIRKFVFGISDNFAHALTLGIVEEGGGGEIGFNTNPYRMEPYFQGLRNMSMVLINWRPLHLG